MHTAPLRRVRRIDHVWIPLADGVRLAARLWLPEDAEADPVPAILEYIPYRKNDATAPRDAELHPYLAARGFAGVRVDLRGSGDSEGVLAGEYLQQELDDGVELIAWLAEQPWCSGRVGMIGKSWGGFNGLQIAALRPPALGCVVSVCSTDDRYADDVHYAGGAVFAAATLSWATTMLGYDARPPDPAVLGPAWRQRWLERLDATRPFEQEWVAHQRRDAFWQHGSVGDDPGAIACHVELVGGFADPYRGAILRLLAAAPDRVRGLIGPWAHVYPHVGSPGPAIGFLQRCVTVFDQHLRGGPGDDEPTLRAFMPERVEPGEEPDVRPGRWIAEPEWPPRGREPSRLALGRGTLAAGGDSEDELLLDGTLAHGADGATWLAWGTQADWAADQRAEDGRSLVFDSAPLPHRSEILGVPELVVTVVPSDTTGQLIARLCDVAPGGSSALVTLGVLNLTHRDGHAEPRPLVPGEPVQVRVPLTAIAHAFPAGHRVRLALAPCYWPWVWPAPGALRLCVRCAGSELSLPVREPRADDDALAPFPPPESATPLAVEQLAPVSVRRSARREAGSGRIESAVDMSYFGSFRLPDGLEYAETGSDRFAAHEHDPLSAEAASQWEIALGRGDWRTRIEARSTMRCDADSFFLTAELRAFDGDELVHDRRFETTIPRDLG
ncbi:MAG: CocE/NonD family hydrolase [Gaiellales bacterium]